MTFDGPNEVGLLPRARIGVRVFGLGTFQEVPVNLGHFFVFSLSIHVACCTRFYQACRVDPAGVLREAHDVALRLTGVGDTLPEKVAEARKKAETKPAGWLNSMSNPDSERLRKHRSSRWRRR